MKHHPFPMDATPSEQEIFDRAVEFFAQPETQRCSNSDGQCLYTNPFNGLHCVAGYMMPEETLKAFGTEVTGIRFAMKNHPAQSPAWARNNLQLLTDLQAVHDDYGTWQSVQNLYGKLAYIAANYNLEYKEPVA
jgi:hypothetical protein